MAVTEPSSVPVLTDGVVTLRAYRYDDVPGMLDVYADPVMHRWTSLAPTFGETEARAWIEESLRHWAAGTQVNWAVEAEDDTGVPRYAGQVDLRLGPVPAIGYFLAPWARGGGRATRAVRLAADWAFDVAKAAVLQWDCRAGHLESWRVAHRCGFRFEGVRTRALPGADGPVDAWTAVLLPDPDDPVATRAPLTTWWPVRTLDGAGVRLRAPAEHDLDRHVEACSDPASRWWSATLPHSCTRDDAEAWLQRAGLDAALGRAVVWTIADPADDRYRGTVSVHAMDRPYTPTGGEIGFRLHPDARGRGVASAAVEAVITHAFTPADDGGLGRHRLGLGASAENTASRRVAERAGFRLVGEFRGDGVHGFDNEIVDDGVWYDLLATDPR
ncbi:GNAT family N-acetyltransferase [Pseudonocardia phyllosphaerae]|uniref:GNAT family N-acetyltransferase n=1 Tax=Pseudonocardia phyllosphaerae TaxID=3390502 RepID=UPI0039799D1D